MHILITNDDGIEAPGIEALEKAIQKTGHSYETVAPFTQYSECSHQVHTQKDLSFIPYGECRHAIAGAPADCVRLALFTQPKRFDLVCSGINAGGNLGVDTFYSGTVAAAREACLHGIPSIAFSNYLKRDKGIAWEEASQLVTLGFENLLQQVSPQHVLNVNFPWDLSQYQTLKWCEAPLEKAPLPLDFKKQEEGYRYSGVYPNRQRTEGSDVDICFSGQISVTPIPVFSA